MACAGRLDVAWPVSLLTSWRAGRSLARDKRSEGGPPLATTVARKLDSYVRLYISWLLNWHR